MPKLKGTLTILSGSIVLSGSGGTTTIGTGSSNTKGDSTITGSLNVTGSTTIIGSLLISSSETLTNIGPAKFLGNLVLGDGTPTSASGFVDGAVMANFAGFRAFAMGNITSASGQYSHTEGAATLARGTGTHAEGQGAIAFGNFSHAEGYFTITSGAYSHAEGANTLTRGDYSHAEGINTLASGTYSHAEGRLTTSSGQYSHAEGETTQAIGEYSHAEGYFARSVGDWSHAEGRNTYTSNSFSHAEGSFTSASGFASHAEGNETQALGTYSHAEGNGTIASGDSQHVQGKFNIANSTEAAFIIGNGTNNNARKNLVFAAGTQFQISGSLFVSGAASSSGSNQVLTYNSTTGLVTYTSSLGFGGTTINNISSSIISQSYSGSNNIINNTYISSSVTGDAVPGGANTNIQFNNAGAFDGNEALTFIVSNKGLQNGDTVEARGSYSHAEGANTLAEGDGSHAEGESTHALGNYSHAEGQNTTSSGEWSHAEGLSTIASGNYQHVQGQYNQISTAQSAFIIGNGVDANNRSNLVFASGSEFQITGSVFIKDLTQSSGSGHVLTYNTASGKFTYTASSAIGGGANAAGNTSEIQFNNGNQTFGASSKFKFDTASNAVLLGGVLYLSESISGVQGQSSIEAGLDNSNYSTSSIVFGSNNNISGSNHVVMGQNITASNSYNIIMGGGVIPGANVVTGVVNIVMGTGIRATGGNTLIVGLNNNSNNKSYSVLVGSNLTSSAQFQMTVGKYNNINASVNGSVFVAGGGLGDSLKKNVFEVSSDNSASGSVMISNNTGNPASGFFTTGSMYFNTTTGKLRIYDGTQWLEFTGTPV